MLSIHDFFEAIVNRIIPAGKTEQRLVPSTLAWLIA
jgi:hypothetical protein